MVYGEETTRHQGKHSEGKYRITTEEIVEESHNEQDLVEPWGYGRAF